MLGGGVAGRNARSCAPWPSSQRRAGGATKGTCVTRADAPWVCCSRLLLTRCTLHALSRPRHTLPQAADAGVRMLALRMELSPPGPPSLPPQLQLQAGGSSTSGAGACGSASLTACAGVQQLPARVVYLGEAQLDLGYGGSSSGGADGGGVADQGDVGGECHNDGGRGVRGGRGPRKGAGKSKRGRGSAGGEGGVVVGSGGSERVGRRKRRGDAHTQQQEGQEGGTQDAQEALPAGLGKRRRRAER